MKELNKLLICLAFMLVIPMISAVSIGTFQQDRCVNLIQTCANCTYSNISSVLYPNSTIILSDVQMTKDKTYYNYSFCNTEALGMYTVTGVGDSNGLPDVWDYTFDITYTGYDINQPQVYIYIIGVGLIVFLMFASIFMITRLPSNDARGTDGEILQVNMLKHLRSVLWIFVWALILALTFVISNLSLAYLNNSMLGQLFFDIWVMMFWATIIALPVYFIWILYKFYKDKEFQDMILRGVNVK